MVSSGCYGDPSAGDSCPSAIRVGVMSHEMGHSLIHGFRLYDYYELAQSVGGTVSAALPRRCVDE
jgi:hypothetical protein